MENTDNYEYAIHDKNGMPIEISKNFDSKISGYAFDIIHKSKAILEPTNSINSIEIFYENAVVLMKDNCLTNLNITMIIDKNK